MGRLIKPAVGSYPSLLSSLLAGGDVSMASWLGLMPSEEACPGLESELSWEVSWLDMDEPDGRMGALLNRAGEKSLQVGGHRDTLILQLSQLMS